MPIYVYNIDIFKVLKCLRILSVFYVSEPIGPICFYYLISFFILSHIFIDLFWKKNLYLELEYLEIDLQDPIRYNKSDPAEKWIYKFLCLENQGLSQINSNATDDTAAETRTYPSLDSCKLFKVSKKVLFSGHKMAEKFLNKIIRILSSAHYKVNIFLLYIL